MNVRGTTGIVRTWNQQLGWGVIDSEATPGGASATATMIRVEAVADLTGFPMMGGLRPGTQVDFEWSVADPPVNGCDYEAQLVWPAGGRPRRSSLPWPIRAVCGTASVIPGRTV